MRQMKAAAVAAGLFCLLFAGDQAQAQATGSLGVRVGNGSALGTSGATVTVKQLYGQGSTQTQTTGNNGRAEFAGLQPGNYEVTVEVDGKRGTSFVRVGTGRQEAPFDSRGLPRSSTAQSTAEELLAALKAAAIACDRAAYDKALEDLQREAALADTNVRDLTKMVEEYGRLSGYQPNLEQLRTTRDRMLRNMQTGRRNATENVRTAGAVVDPGLLYLSGFIDALERLAKARERQQALDAAVRQIPPFERRCSMSLQDRLKWQVLLSSDIAFVLLDRPSSDSSAPKSLASSSSWACSSRITPTARPASAPASVPASTRHRWAATARQAWKCKAGTRTPGCRTAPTASIRRAAARSACSALPPVARRSAGTLPEIH
jgi:hypothetical protein